jgi:hypothetical protein
LFVPQYRPVNISLNFKAKCLVFTTRYQESKFYFFGLSSPYLGMS